MKTYELDFLEDALKEWKKLKSAVRNQFARKLAERLIAPRVASARLSGMRNCYKIELRASGYRLVYQVEDDVLIVARHRCRAARWEPRVQGGGAPY